MKTHIRSGATDLLWVLRSVESTPDGDIAWAEHCTRQQAVIVRLHLPRGKVTSIDVLTEAVGIPIDVVPDIPVNGTAFYTATGWRIHISSSLSPTDQVWVALHELKHIIDNPVRRRTKTQDFNAADFEYLADYFADCVMREVKP